MATLRHITARVRGVIIVEGNGCTNRGSRKQTADGLVGASEVLEVTERICLGNIYFVTFETFGREHEVCVTITASPAPNGADGSVPIVVGCLNALDVSIKLEAFEIVAHDDVHHASYRVSSIESRAAIS